MTSTIFISHATLDDATIDRIYAPLLKAGFAAWVDHQRGITYGDQWAQKIQDAVNACDFGLFVMSPHSVKSEWCNVEWNRIRNLGKSLYVALITPVPKADVPLLLDSIQYADLTVDFDGKLAELMAVMQGKGSGAAGAPTPLVSSRVTGRMDDLLKNVPMSGRDDDLKAVNRLLNEAPVVISGPGGLGKSRLAAEVVFKNAPPGGVIWHRCTPLTTAGDVLGQARQHCGLGNDSQSEAVLEALSREARLVVLDNGEDVPPGDERRKAYVQLVGDLRNAGAAVLLTSRVEWDELKPRRKYTPTQLPLEAAVQVVKDMSAALDVPAAVTKAEELAQAARQHPRLIEVAVVLVEQFGVNKVIHDLEALKGLDVEAALDDMVLKSVRQMTETTSNGEAAARALSRLAVCAGGFSYAAAGAVAGLAAAELDSCLKTLQSWRFVNHNAALERYSLDPLVQAVVGGGASYPHPLAPSPLHGEGGKEADTGDQSNDGAVVSELAAARAAHFAYYYSLHGDHEANNDETRHPQITADFENVRAALAWGWQNEAEKACDWMNALNYYMQLHQSYGVWRELLTQTQQAAEASSYERGQANTLQALGDLDLREAAYPSARANYQAARALFEAIPDRLGQANTLQALGDLDLREAAYPSARANYQAARALFEAIPDRLGQANTLQALGDLDLREAAYPSARANYQAARALFEAIPDRLGQANTLKALGDLDLREAAYPSARANYQAARALFEAIPARLGQANTLQALGDLDRMEAAYPSARANYQAARALFEAIPDRLGQANTLQALGDLDRMEAAYPSARANYQAARALFEAIPARLGQANTLKALGDLDLREAAYPSARANYQAARALFEAIPDRLGQANTLKALGDLDLREAAYPSARANYQAARALFEAIPDRLGQANTLQALGDLDLREAAYPSARANYQAARALFEAIPDRLGQANTLQALGDLDLREAAYPSARANYQAALEWYVRIPDRVGQMNTYVNLARLERALENTAAACEHYEQWLAIANSIPAFAKHPVTERLRQEYAEVCG